MKEKIQFPLGADKALLRKFHLRATADLDKEHKEAHAAFLREAEHKFSASTHFADSLGLNRNEVEKVTAVERTRLEEFMRGAEPARPQVLKGHNPARYATYDVAWSSLSSSGITIKCEPFGPSMLSGGVGAELRVLYGGGASSGSAVGFWYYAQQSGALYTTVQALVWGGAAVMSNLFGYASAWCALRVYVQRYSPSVTYIGSADIYNNSGVVQYDFRNFPFTLNNVSLVAPVEAGNWYLIWGAAYQSAYAGGLAGAVSNFQVQIGPICYSLV